MGCPVQRSDRNHLRKFLTSPVLFLRLETDQVLHHGQWVYIDGLFYALVMPLVKTAMLIEWCRMFVPRGTRTRNYFWWGSIILITISCTAGVVFFILIAARCQPYEANFNPLLVAGCKYTLNPIQTGSSILQIITDIAVFLLPQPVIWRLKLDWQERAGVSIIFSVGLL